MVQLKKLENVVRNLTIICLTSCNTLMANSLLVAIGDRVAQSGSTVSEEHTASKLRSKCSPGDGGSMFSETLV
jgi:hypothetical protein